MLLNFTNHPSNIWSEKQKKNSKTTFRQSRGYAIPSN